MAYDFGPLNTHDTQRVQDTVLALANLGLSQSDIASLLGQSQVLGRSALEDYMNAAGMQIGQSFQPQFDQARNFLGANPLLADSGYANRLNRQLLTDLAARESGAFNDAAAQQAQNQVNYLQSLQGQRIGLRQNLAGQAYNTIMNPPKKQSTKDKIIGAGAQVAGAVGGALLGGPPGAAAGYQAGGALGSSGGYAPGYQQYMSQYGPTVGGVPAYGGVPMGGYSEPVSGPRRFRF